MIEVVKINFKKFDLAFNQIYLFDKKQIRSWVFKTTMYKDLYKKLIELRIVSPNKKKTKQNNFAFVYLIWLLKRQFNINENNLKVNENGKKYLQNSSLQFSFSHSHRYYAWMISKSNIGIDIEKIHSFNYKRIIKKYPILFEKVDDLLSFYRTWCMSEAYTKMQGENLVNVLEKMEFSQLMSYHPYIETYKKYMIVYMKENYHDK